MLLRNASRFFVATIVQAASGLALLSLLTRALPPEEYGRYALALALLQIGGGPLFHWSRCLVSRFLVRATARGERDRLLMTAWLGTIGSGAVAAAATRAATGLADPGFAAVLWAMLPALILQAAFQMRMEIHRAEMRQARCALLIASQGLLAIPLSLLFALPCGLGAGGALYGLAGSCAVCLAADRGARARWARPLGWRALRPMLGYAMPLALILALEMGMQSGDRLVVASLLDGDALAAYAAPQALAMRGIASVCLATSAASLPLVIATLERQGAAAARAVLRQSGELMLAAVLPCTVAFVALAGPITDVLIGAALRGQARAVLPLVAIGTCLNAIAAHYVAHGFHLARRTATEVLAILPASVAGVALNVVLVPAMGVIGAGYALVGAQAVYVLASLLLVRRVFAVPVPWRRGGVVLGASLTGAALVDALPLPGGVWGLLLGGAVLGACAAAGVLISGIAGLRGSAERVCARLMPSARAGA